MIIGQNNRNSKWKKLDMLSDLTKNKVDTMMVSETRIHDNFLTGQSIFHTPSESFPDYNILLMV